jgi:hypothetical protein
MANEQQGVNFGLAGSVHFGTTLERLVVPPGRAGKLRDVDGVELPG